MGGMIELDRRHPLAVDLKSFGRRPGTMESGELTVPTPSGVGTEVMQVPEGSEMDLDLRLERAAAEALGSLLAGSAQLRAAAKSMDAGTLLVRPRRQSVGLTWF